MKIPFKYSKFGYTFNQPIRNSWGMPQRHSGIDLNFGNGNEDCGNTVYAMADGKAIYSAYARGWGNMIVVRHDLPKKIEVNGIKTNVVWSRYAHLNVRNVKLNERVKEGDLIGNCGNTGGNWKCHLHFDVIIQHLGNWEKYTTWWSSAKTKEYYADPIPFINGYNESQKKKIIDKDFQNFLIKYDIDKNTDPNSYITYKALSEIIDY